MNSIRFIIFCMLVSIACTQLPGGNSVVNVNELLSKRQSDPVLQRALEVATDAYSKVQNGLALGDPSEISMQIVSGVKYTFKYNVGEKIWRCVVYCQPWTHTYEVMESDFE